MMYKKKRNIVAKIASASALLLMAACASEKTDELGKEDLNLGFIAFGDSGYHVNYLKEKQYSPARPTQDTFLAAERADWVKKKRPEAEFVAPPSEYVDAVGSFVASGGLYPVADAMQSYCLGVSCEFSVMLGDNIYPDGATSTGDDSARFDTLFSKPLGKLGEGNDNYRIYTALGNHDWNTSREGAMAQVNFMETTKPFYMDGLFYTVKPTAAKGEVELFVIDTEIMLSGTIVYEAELNDDGSERATDEMDLAEEWTKAHNASERNMVAWLEESLKNSTAKWKFVIGHHPIWSSGGTKFEQAKSLRKLILPAMCRYADVYFAGHEHSLELHEDSCESVFGKGNAKPLLHIVSGAASKQRPVHVAFKGYQDKSYPENSAIFAKGMTWGFAHINLDGDTAVVDLITTPNSGDATTHIEFSHQFNRRSNTSFSK